jgi:hypothetical protein
VFLVSGAVRVWLFYVQHQFEDTYWQAHTAWRYDHAALAGSSYFKLPRVLQFFTGNTGFRHLHGRNDAREVLTEVVHPNGATQATYDLGCSSSATAARMATN